MEQIHCKINECLPSILMYPAKDSLESNGHQERTGHTSMQVNLDASFCLLCQVGDDVICPHKISRDVRYICTYPKVHSVSGGQIHTILFQSIRRMYSSSTNAVNYFFNLLSSSLFRADNIIAFTADFVPKGGVLKIMYRLWPDTMTS